MPGEWAGVIERQDFTVFGRRLHPLTMRHLYLLTVIESPVLTGHDLAAADLLLAAWLCCWPADIAQASLENGGRLSEQFTRWGSAWGAGAAPDRTFAAEAAIFRDYLAWWMRAPSRWEPSPGTPRVQTPWVLFLVAELRRHLGCSEAEVWAMAPTKAFAMYAATAEAQGDTSLKSDSEAALADQLHQQALEQIAAFHQRPLAEVAALPIEQLRTLFAQIPRQPKQKAPAS